MQTTNDSGHVAVPAESTDTRLEKADLAIILQVYRYNAAFPQAPFLPAERKQKRAKALAERGLLKLETEALGVGPSWGAFRITKDGIDAYNAALAKAGAA